MAVAGHSMEPTLLDGDWLLVDPVRADQLQSGDLVVARDPRAGERLLVKRVVSTAPLLLAGDHPAHANDQIGPVEPDGIIGRPWFRYWPVGRIGRVG